MHDFIDIAGNCSTLKYGKYPGSRSIEDLLSNGVVILDKWSGPTSHDVASILGTKFGVKVGHSGTLDPMVSGVLPVTLGNACKTISLIQGSDKVYIGVMKIHSDIQAEDIKKEFSFMVGEIIQKPPVRSAVSRNERVRIIKSLELLEMDGRSVLFRIECQAGTYVRLVCHKIGEKIGGAHMSELRRVAVGRFTESMSVKMHDLSNAYDMWKESGDQLIRNYVLPVEVLVEGVPKMFIKDSAVCSVSKGSPLHKKGVCKIEKSIQKGQKVALMTLQGELIAIGKSRVSSDNVNGIVADVNRVVMVENSYPNKI